MLLADRKIFFVLGGTLLKERQRELYLGALLLFHQKQIGLSRREEFFLGIFLNSLEAKVV